MKRILSILFILLLLNSGIAQETDEDFFHPTTIEEMNVNVRIFGSGEISGLKEGGAVTFEALTFQENENQKITSISETLIINGKTILPEHVLDEFNNKHVKFIIEENGSFNYELKATAKTKATTQENIDALISEKFGIEEQYLLPTSKIESNTGEIQTLVKNKFKTEKFLETLKEVIEWVNDYVEYAEGNDFQKYYAFQRSAIDTLRERKGVCDEFSNLAAAILRSKNIPTKIAIGVVYDGKKWGNHAWLEVYHPDEGWIATDPTFREIGFVDGTHIKMGAYNDVTKSLAKASYPKGVSVTLNTQTLPDITINSKKYFDKVDTNIVTKDLNALQWNEMKIKIKNKTNEAIFLPVVIPNKYSELIFAKSKKTIHLEANEEKEISFTVYPNINLGETQVAKAQLGVNTLSEKKEEEIEIRQKEDFDNGWIELLDITPINTNGNLNLEITIANRTKEIQEFEIKIKSGKSNYNSTENIGPITEQTYVKKINSIEGDYSIKILFEGEEFSQDIVAIKTTPDLNKDENLNQKEIIKPKANTSFQSILSQPVILLVAGLLAIAILILGIFNLRKKYI